MITDEDTTKIVNKVVEANKLLFYDKLEMDKKFEDQRKDFNNLQASVVSFAKVTKDNADGLVVANSRIAQTENWIRQASPKIGLEYRP